MPFNKLTSKIPIWEEGRFRFALFYYCPLDLICVMFIKFAHTVALLHFESRSRLKKTLMVCKHKYDYGANDYWEMTCHTNLHWKQYIQNIAKNQNWILTCIQTVKWIYFRVHLCHFLFRLVCRLAPNPFCKKIETSLALSTNIYRFDPTIDLNAWTCNRFPFKSTP